MPFSDFDNLLVSIETWRNTYLRASDIAGKILGIPVVLPPILYPIVDQQTTVGGWEKWGVVPRPNGKYAFKGAHNKYMRADSNTPEVTQTDTIQAWEEWEVTEDASGSTPVYSFKSAHGLYLRASEEGPMTQTKSVSTWEKFTVEVVGEFLGIFDMSYDLEQAKKWNDHPKTLISQTLTNHGDIAQQMTVQINEQYAVKNSFGQKVGAKVSCKVSGGAKVPFVADGKVEVTAEVSAEFSFGQEITKTHTFVATIPFTAPPRSQCTGKVKFHETKLNVPWKAKAAWKGVDDKRYLSDIGGVWDGTCVYDISYTVEKPVLL